MIPVLLKLLRIFLWIVILYILENIPCILGKWDYIHLAWNVLNIYLNSNVSFMVNISLIILILDNLSIDVSKLLISPFSFILLSIFPLLLWIFNSCIYLLLFWMHIYLLLLYILIGLIPLSLHNVLLCLITFAVLKFILAFWFKMTE